jgi:hypothetical protein
MQDTFIVYWLLITPFGNVSGFIYLGTTITNQDFIHEEIRSRLNSEDA